MSTYRVDGDLKNHEEKTTLEEPMRVRNIAILEDSPVWRPSSYSGFDLFPASGKISSSAFT